MRLSDLKNGDMFAYDYNLNEVYKLLGLVEEDKNVWRFEVISVASYWPYEREWKLNTGRSFEKSYDCDVYRSSIDFKVEVTCDVS